MNMYFIRPVRQIIGNPEFIKMKLLQAYEVMFLEKNKMNSTKHCKKFWISKLNAKKDISCKYLPSR